MPLVISDEVLKEAGLSETEALREIACRLYDAGKLTLWQAAKLARLSRIEFERALIERNLPVFRPTLQDLADDLATLDRLGT